MDAHGQNQVIHQHSDSDTHLEALFDVLKQGNQTQQQTPLFRNRNLPVSFFEPPARPSHSRESSQDSTSYRSNPTPLSRGPAHPGLAINHGRSQSSPAQLPLTLSAAPPPSSQPQHNKQNSMDFVEGMGQLHIPSGPDTGSWGPLKTEAQRYFNNSQEQLAWTKSHSTNALNPGTPQQQGARTPQGTLSPAHPSSPSVSLQNLGPLPRGWEQGVTPDGEIYFINHLDRTTSWFDPRIPKNLQRPGPVKLGQSIGAPALLQPAQQPPQLSQQPAPQQQPTQATIQPSQLSAALQQQQQQGAPTLTQPPPMQQPQQVSPAAPQQVSPPQPQPQQPATQQPTSTTQQPASSSASNSQNPQFIQYELERLKQEKDRLQREQEIIGQRELLLKEMMSTPKASPHSESQHSPAPAPTSIQAVSSSGIDPFLGQGNTNEAHARQNSGDSGLGGMGNNYSLPRTPEDFLSNVDEMDIQDGSIKMPMLKTQSGSDFNMNDLQSNVCMDVGPLGDPDQSGMEEDLVPSLQEDISSLSSDLLNDVDVGKMDNLLWL